tara:strand:- start:57 stop:359 length:303 start_codon:yes stop_codon:yes gene_type:complete
MELDFSKQIKQAQKKKKEAKAELTKEQKTLPPALQKKILEKKGKSPKNQDKDKKEDKKESKAEYEAHMMYDPKTGKGYMAKEEKDHIRMKKMGYSHEKPA